MRKFVFSLLTAAFLAAGNVFAAGLDKNSTAELTQARTLWLQSGAEMGASLGLSAGQLKDQQQVIQFYAEALEWRAQGQPLRSLHAPWLKVQARAFSSIVVTLLNKWDEFAARQADQVSRRLTAIQTQFGSDGRVISGRAYDHSPLAPEMRALIQAAIQSLANPRIPLSEKRLKMVLLNRQLAEAQVELAEDWGRAKAVLGDLKRALDFLAVSPQGPSYADLFAVQFLVGAIKEAGETQFGWAEGGEDRNLAKWEDFFVEQHFSEIARAATTVFQTQRFDFEQISDPLLARKLTNLDANFSHSYLAIPYAKNAPPLFELSLGFLPLHFVRLHWQTPVPNHGYYADFHRAGSNEYFYNTEGFGDLSSTLRGIHQVLVTWKTLVAASSEPVSNVISLANGAPTGPTAFEFNLAKALLHFIRFDSVSTYLPQPDWGNVNSLSKLLIRDFLFGDFRTEFFNHSNLQHFEEVAAGLYTQLLGQNLKKFAHPRLIAKSLNLLVASVFQDPRLTRGKMRSPFKNLALQYRANPVSHFLESQRRIRRYSRLEICDDEL